MNTSMGSLQQAQTQLQSQSPSIIDANGAKLYCEVRGAGPSVLFISGSTGDAGHYERVAELLADEFTVVTYDRRGNSRSPRPEGWSKTSADEQADDAAGLLRALGLAPAAVFASSGGAVIGLNLVIRYPEVVRGAILHEPPLISALAHPDEVMKMIQQHVEPGMAAGGPRGAVEAFVRFVAGDAIFEALNPSLRERMLNNGQTIFGVEFGALESYHPEDATLSNVRLPVQVMAGLQSPPFLQETSQWLAEHLHVQVVRMPGAHTPYFDQPQAMVDAIRPFLRQVS